MKPLLIRRPKSLAEVAQESETYQEFGMNLKDFLHEFAQARKLGNSLDVMLATEPVWLKDRFAEGNICDAFLAGTADFLSRVSRLPTPEWALHPARMLEHPWFSEPWLNVRAMLLRDSPSAFKDKNIFVFESALRVA